MNKLILIAFLTFVTSCLGQATVNLGSVRLSPEQVTGMLWHWGNYTNATSVFNSDTNNTPVPILTSTQWFVSEGTNLVLTAVNRKVSVYDQTRRQAMIDVIATNAVKRAQIEAIVNAP
jgi:hypothetical protein